MAALAVVTGVAVSGGQLPVAAAGGTPSLEAATKTNGKDAQQKDTPESLALAEAKRSGKDVNVGSLEDESSDVAAKPDGTLVATMHSKPVRTRKDGAWHDIDTALRTTPSGAVAPKAALTDLEFSGGGTQPLVRLADAGKELNLTWPKPLPAPVISGSTAEYRSVLPDVDLRMTATDAGYTQLIVVKTAEAAKNPELDQLKLGMSSTGLVVKTNPDRSLALVDKAAGGTVFRVPPPMMFDSSPVAKEGPGGPTVPVGPQRLFMRSAAASAPVESPVHAAPVDVQVPQDQKSLVLTPDQKLLDDPNTVFPVMIDPSPETTRAGNWTGISRAYPGQPYWHFTYNSSYVGDFGTGYCAGDSRCAPEDVKRVLYSFPVQGKSFVGKRILDARFNVFETHSYSCSPSTVELWDTWRINSGTTWNNASGVGANQFWNKLLEPKAAARGYDGCAGGYLEFAPTALKNSVQSAANNNWQDLTLGLKAANESDAYGWKRFGDQPSLQVFYNLPPSQPSMSALSMQPGSECTTPTKPIRSMPELTAAVTDPDGGSIGVQFAAAWVGSDGVFKRRWFSTGGESVVPAASTFKLSGSLNKASSALLQMSRPEAVPQNQVVGWEARGWDGLEWGPWSSDGDRPTDCYFLIDTTVPAGPTVASPSMLGSTDSQAVLPWTDGVGRYATFTFTTPSTDVVKYQYGINQDPSAANEVATTNGAARSVNLLMDKEGPRWLSVRALDAAGNASQNTTFYFNVRNGQPQRAGWAMDSLPGATSLPATSSNLPMTLAGGAASGAPGHSGTGISLSGTLASDGTPADYAAADTPAVETDQSFTVSAWVNTSDAAKNQSAVSQSGQHQAAFSLGLSQGKWTIKLPTTDTTPDTTWYVAASDVAPVANQWTHLAGVYDAAAKTLTMYVNGTPSAPVAGVNIWQARGALSFGRALWRDSYTDGWKGSLDDIHVWDRALKPADVAAVQTGTAITGLGAKAVWSLDESGPTMAGLSETSDAATTGDVQAGVSGTSGKAVHFGPTGYADAARPQVNATASFSVAAWVKLPAVAAGDTSAKVVVNQFGTHNSEFSLYYSVWQKKWVFGRYTQDAADAQLIKAYQPDCTAGQQVNGAPCFGIPAGEWMHLLGVSDAVAHKIRLYLNGYLVGETPYTQGAPWAGTGGVRIGAVSREGAPDEFFGGDIDDVRLFDRVVTGPEAIAMVQQRPQLAGRWQFDSAPSGTAPDDRKTNPATLLNQAVIDSGTAHVGAGALSLDGANAYAATSGTPLDTSQSFSIAGWAQTAGSPNRNMTVLSVGDSSNSALTVRWNFLKSTTDEGTGEKVNTGQWQVETVDASSPAVHSKIVHTFAPTQDFNSRWNHLTVTYDAFTHQLALYTNGQLQNEVCDAQAPAGTCSDHVSFTTVNQPFKATGKLQFGRNVNSVAPEAFSGQIDDVWAYQGVLSPAQIAVLASGTQLDSATAMS
ncbi:LamG-like jellyroll fold domain-containing protein [Streptomyces violascens]|uniref:LamG-like jellyroll fold domain-containing protein n=1 Tax=Streptomyces violascens TaxID=67381 RepID=UPI00379CD295